MTVVFPAPAQEHLPPGSRLKYIRLYLFALCLDCSECPYHCSDQIDIIPDRRTFKAIFQSIISREQYPKDLAEHRIEIII